MEETPELKRIKQLEKENAELKEQLSNQTTEKTKRGWWITKTIGNWFMGGTLRKALNQSIDELKTDGKLSQETGVHLGASIFERFTRIGLFAILAALIPILILCTQTWILNNQNELLSKQNTRLDQQTYLQEADRRSSLVFLFNNIMDAIDKELKEDYGNDDIRNLSPQLTGRIIALSTRLEPYYYMQGDSLIDKPLSPERGQLLVSLLESQLDTTALDKIYAKADFSYADLINDNLEGAYISGATLDYADLSMARLRDADLSKANLWDADLSMARLRYADLSKARLWYADLSRARLWDADLSEADLRNADLNSARLEDADLNWARLEDADLRMADLWDADLNMAVVEKNWFELHEKSKIAAFEEIKKKYEIVGDERHSRLLLKSEE